MGFKGEIKRFGGDASLQRAKQIAEQFKGVVITGEDYKCRGVSPCFVVLDAKAEIPAGAKVSADYRS